MKKTLAWLLALVTLIILCIPASAEDVPAIDITAEIKVATTADIYQNKLPVIRTDAQFLDPMDWTNTDTKAQAGSATRMLTVTDAAGWTNFNNDEIYSVGFEDGNAYFSYYVIWAGITEPLTFDFSVPEDGDYEFVVVGAAQIKADAVDNDAKDRGFCISVDDGPKYQVNISDTPGIFRDYTYTYTYNETQEYLITANGKNSQKYQMGYYYNITMHLTKGKHVYKFYNLEYSGSTALNGNTSSRLNYAGTFVQKYMSDSQLEGYTYPVVTTAEATTAAATTKAVETKAVTTAEVTTAEVTEAQPEEVVETVAPAPEETEAPKSSGCSSSLSFGFVTMAALIGSAWVAKKKY